MNDLSHDHHSYSNPQEVRVTHVALDLQADFEARRLRGSATLTLAPHQASTLVLDTRELIIESVTAGGAPATYSLGPADPILGSALSIAIHPGVAEVLLHYQTNPSAGGLQ